MGWKDDAKNANSGKFLKFEDKAKFTIRVYDEPEEREAEGYDGKKKKSYDFPIECEEHPNLEIMSAYAGSMLLKALGEEDETEPLIGRWISITRKGTGKNTQFIIRPVTKTRAQQLPTEDEEQPDEPRRAPAKKPARQTEEDEEMEENEPPARPPQAKKPPRLPAKPPADETPSDDVDEEELAAMEALAKIREAKKKLAEKAARMAAKGDADLEEAGERADQRAADEEKPLVKKGGFKPVEEDLDKQPVKQPARQRAAAGPKAQIVKLECDVCGHTKDVADNFWIQMKVDKARGCDVCARGTYYPAGSPGLQAQSEEEKPKSGKIERETPEAKEPRTKSAEACNSLEEFKQQAALHARTSGRGRQGR